MHLPGRPPTGGESTLVIAARVFNKTPTANQGAAAPGTVTATAGALTSNAVVLGNGGADLKALASLGTSGHVLTSNGAGVPPSFQVAGAVGGGLTRPKVQALFQLPSIL